MEKNDASDQAVEPALGPTRASAREGALSVLPFVPGGCVFGLAVGALAAQKGLSLFETLAMSAFVFAGASQITALQLWPDAWTLAGLAAIVGVTAGVNLRFILMSASLRPWFAPLPARIVYGGLVTLTDVNWATTVAYQARGGRDFGFFIGAGLSMWVVWNVATGAGFLMTGLIADPKALGLDLVVLLVFAALCAPVLRRAQRLWPFAAAAAAGLATSLLSEGYWFVIAGALTGAAVAAAGRDA